MFALFRRIRKALIDSARFRKYSLYAFGEIFLVVIGILIALQINNWNSNRKEVATTRDMCEKLLISLKLDSSELARINRVQEESVNTFEYIINTSYSKVMPDISQDSLKHLCRRINRGRSSFFPKYGTYNNIVSNNNLKFLDNEEIQSLLVTFYDYQCKRYENIDLVLDEMYNKEITPVLVSAGYVPMLEPEVSIQFSEELFTSLQLVTSNAYVFIEASSRLIQQLQASVDQLINLLTEYLIH